MPEYDQITFDEDNLVDSFPVYAEKNLEESWPNRRIRTGMWWNNASQEWHFTVDLLDFGKIIPFSPVKLNLPYSYRDYIRVIFYDPTGRASKITPRNMSNTIEMQVWPGPESDAYEPRVIERPLLGEIEEEPWREIIGYERTTEVVEEPLPPGENEQ